MPRDDRRRPFTFCVPTSQTSAPALEALCRVHRGGPYGLLVPLVIAAVAYVGLRTLLIGNNTKWWQEGIGVAVGAATAASGFVAARIHRAKNDALAREAVLREGLCPACLYDPRDSPVQQDGCRVCPECGAAWRLPGP